MKFENTFTVQAPVEQVWSTLMDIERVAPAMPGAEVLERTADNAYKVGVKVKLGPMSMMYRGQVEITERDDVARQAVMRARATEARGQGTANASIHMSLAEDAGGTTATIETDLAMSGRAAAMGSGVIGDVAGALVEEFAANLAGMLSGDGGAPESGQSAVSADDADQPASSPASQPAPSGAGQPAPSGAGQPAPPGASQPASSPASEDASSGAGQPPPPPRATPAGSSVPLGRIAASVISRRLSDPPTLLITTATFAIACIAIGYAIGRAR